MNDFQNTFIFGDCHKVLPILPAGFAKVVRLDMPYCTTDSEYDLKFAEMLIGRRRSLNYTRLNDRLAMHDYLLQTLLPALKRVCAPNAVIIATSNRGFTDTLNFAWGDYKVDNGIWLKRNHTNQAALQYKMPARFENITVFALGKKYTFNPLMGVGKPYKAFSNDLKQTGEANGRMKSVHRENTGTRYMGGVFEYGRETGFHCTPKPTGLEKDLLHIFSNEGDLVLDPFAGSGTTAVACLHTKRNYVCIEGEITYYVQGLERINSEKNNLLFEN